MIDDSDLPLVGIFLEKVKMLAGMHDFSVTSWGRTAMHNAAVGGSSNSKHLDWLALDVVFDTVVERDHFVASAKACGLTVIEESTHVHVHLKT